ncbi:hypothetical protein NOW33_RS26485, partial [Escherichia coli]
QGGKVDLVPVDNSSGVAALRGDVAPVLPWYFRSPLTSAGADKKRDNHQIIYRFSGQKPC